MTQTQQSPLTEAQQEIVLACDGRIRHLAWKYSRHTHDFEEMHSIGMEAVCKVVASVSLREDDPFGYLYRSAQNAMIDELKRKEQASALSLDAPFEPQSTFCLADVVPACPPVSAPTEQTARTVAVQKALTRLAKREREVLSHRHGLDEACGTHSNTFSEIGKTLGMTCSGAASIATVAHRKLRADKELCRLLGVEPQPKVQDSPEMLAQRYARELSTWNAGCNNAKSLSKALRISRSSAYKCLAKLREVGLIPLNTCESKQKGCIA